jgi:hypothetical protein
LGLCSVTWFRNLLSSKPHDFSSMLFDAFFGKREP